MDEDFDESVNNEEVADLQDSNEVEEVSDENTGDDISEETSEVAKPDESPDDTESNSEKQSTEDNSKFAAARRESEKQMRDLKFRQDNFAKQYGYNSFEEMEQAQHAQKYVEQGYDEEMAKRLVTIDNYEKDLQNRLNSARIAEEKSKLKDQPYFKELEADIDEILQQNNALDVQLVFDVIKGRNMPKLMEKQTKAAAQKALNNMDSKSHIKPDGKGVDIDDITVDESEFKFYQRLNPKGKREDYIKFLKQEKRR